MITTHRLLEQVRPRYQEIFAALSAHGIEQHDLVIAWDFTTASRESVHADLIDARAAALPRYGTDGANLTYTATPMVSGRPADLDPLRRHVRRAAVPHGTAAPPLSTTALAA